MWKWLPWCLELWSISMGNLSCKRAPLVGWLRVGVANNRRCPPRTGNADVVRKLPGRPTP